jgi:GlpG protein
MTVCPAETENRGRTLAEGGPRRRRRVRGEDPALRQIGTLSKTNDPQVFGDYLLSLGVSSRAIPAADGWAIWVHDEDKVDRARAELLAYEKNPDDPRYDSASPLAQAARREKECRDQEFRKNFRQVSESRQSLNFRKRPVTLILVAICIVVFLGEQMGQQALLAIEDALGFYPSMQDPRNLAGGLDAIRQGEVWRLVTPIFLHFGLLHIVFNSWMMLALGTAIEYCRGSRTLLALTLVSAVASNVGQYLYDVYFTQHLVPFGGISGVVFALFGYIWMKGEIEPHQGMRLHPSSVRMILLWLILGFTGVMGRAFGLHLANGAHLVGLVVGVLFGLARL